MWGSSSFAILGNLRRHYGLSREVTSKSAPKPVVSGAWCAAGIAAVLENEKLRPSVRRLGPWIVNLGMADQGGNAKLPNTGLVAASLRADRGSEVEF